MEIPKAIEKYPNYENFEARCPICNYWNIFNRASDMKSFKLITGQAVICQNDKCAKEFWIGGDLVNPAWQMLIRDCWFLKEQKRYSYCILNLCQAYEMFFTFFLRATLIYKPYEIENNHSLERLNESSRNLFDKIKEWTYFRLRNTFMQLLIQNVNCHNINQGQSIIEKLYLYADEPDEIKINLLNDKILAEALVSLKRISIHVLRNQVVHKNGYCPTLEEVEIAEENVRVLYKLNHCLLPLFEQCAKYEIAF
jgi:hypothetical protein